MSLLKTKSYVLLTILVTAVALLGVSCAKTEEPPPAVVKWDKVVIPVAVDLSGPYAAQNQLVINGLTDCLGYVNEQGGVKGVPLEFVIRDTGGKPDNAVTVLNEFLAMNPRPALVSFLDSQIGVALKDRFTEEKVVNITGGTGSALYPPGYTFAIWTEGGDQFGLFCDYIIEKEAPKKPKLAILTWDNVFGNVILEQRCLDYAKSKGIDIVETQLYSVYDTTVADQLKKIKDAGAEWVYTNTLLIGPARINNDAITLGIQNQMKWGVIGVAISYNTMGLGRGMEGWIGPSPWASWDETDIQGVQVMQQQFEKNNRESSDRQNVYCGSFIAALLMKQTFEKAVDTYGWEGVTGENVLKVLEQTKDFDAMGLTKISFSPELRHGLYCKIYEMKQGKILPLTDWRQATHLK